MPLHRDVKAELIRSIPLFAGCTPDEIHEVAAIADEIDLRAGKQLATENTAGREFVVIVEGTASVSQGADTINRMGPGDWFGELSLLNGGPRTATVVATSPLHALVIEGHRFTQLMEHSPHIRAKIDQVVAQRQG